jgi:glyoxylase I family protein
VRFDQVKILARDLDLLVGFYEEVLGCEVVVPPLSTDSVVARGVGVPDGTVTLCTLRLPGRGDRGPTLELYSVEGDTPEEWAYRPGSGQLAFQVDDLEAAIGKVMAAGGSNLGEVVEWQGLSGSPARFVYLRDPEGNIVDLYSRVD